jgi:H+/gluconate symporter-like permease
MTYFSTKTQARVGSVKGLWAIIISLTLAIVYILIFFRKYNSDMIKSMNEGTMGSLLPIFNTASEVGYGAVIAGLSSFIIVRDSILNISPSNPLISEALAVNMLSGITGSASGGLSITLEVLGNKYMEMAHQLSISPELLHRIATLSSGGFDTLPHNGAVISLLTICGMTHKDSYKDIFMVAVAIPVLATIVVIVLGSLFGSF